MALPPLSPEQQIKPRFFEGRMSLVYFAIFFPVGVHVPYFPLWLESVGFDAAQIGIILAAPQFVRLLTTHYITSFADRASDRAHVAVTVIAATLLISAGYFLTPAYWVVLLVSVVIHIFWSPHTPLVDSIALSGVRRFGSSYPSMRIWGSIAFMAGSYAAGVILSFTSPAAIPWIIFTGLFVALAASVFLPRLGRPRQASALSVAELQTAAPSLLTRNFLLLVAGAGIIHSSHSYLFSFGSIYWTSIGISDAVIGAFWAFAVLAEICMFLVFTRVFAKVRNTTILLIAGVAAITRWVFFPLIWGSGVGIAGFFASQALHSFSTALILLGVQKIIAESVGEERTGAAQGIAFVANSIAFALVTLASGPIYQQLGVNGFFLMAVVALIGMICVALAAASAPQRAIGR
ncbi:MAG TPA: MFS transporter [Rhizobiaceae bacterium]|nr:MFS transporter [Rhizobiaceae bacterium]